MSVRVRVRVRTRARVRVRVRVRATAPTHLGGAGTEAHLRALDRRWHAAPALARVLGRLRFQLRVAQLPPPVC